MTYKTITDSEINDFNQVCKSHGRDPSEFDMVEHDVIYTPDGSGLYCVNGKITITLIKDSRARTYETGNGSSWVCYFEADLKKGYFN